MTDTPDDLPPDAPPTTPGPAVPDPPPSAAWPEVPYTPASPQFPEQPGARLKVFANVAIFGLNAREEGEVFDTDEVKQCERAGLLKILG